MSIKSKILGVSLFLLLTMYQVSLSAQDIKTGVVQIIPQNKKKTPGTGFIVELTQNMAYIVTASHVVEGEKNPEVKFYIDFELDEVKVVHREPDNIQGLALLSVKGKEKLPSGLSALSFGTPREKDNVTFYGYPRIKGIYQWDERDVQITSRYGRVLNLSQEFEVGSSGGPLIKDGKVVGMLAGTTERGHSLPAASIRDFLKGHDILGKSSNQMINLLGVLGIPVVTLIGSYGPPWFLEGKIEDKEAEITNARTQEEIDKIQNDIANLEEWLDRWREHHASYYTLAAGAIVYTVWLWKSWPPLNLNLSLGYQVPSDMSFKLKPTFGGIRFQLSRTF